MKRRRDALFLSLYFNQISPPPSSFTATVPKQRAASIITTLTVVYHAPCRSLQRPKPLRNEWVGGESKRRGILPISIFCLSQAAAAADIRVHLSSSHSSCRKVHRPTFRVSLARFSISVECISTRLERARVWPCGHRW